MTDENKGALKAIAAGGAADRAGSTARPAARRIEVPIKKATGPGDDKVHTWPHLVRLEFLVAIFIVVLLIVWSLLVDAPLEEPANPTRTPNPSKAPWYFLGLQEMLVFFDPWHAGVVLPSLIIIGLMVIPYIDINPKGNGYYTFAERKFEILTYFFGFHVLWVSLIIIGTFLRGPGWNWFWPWQQWDAHKVEAMTNIDLPYKIGLRDPLWSSLFGLAVVLGYFAVGTGAMYAWVRRLKGTEFMQRWGMPRFFITVFLFLNMLAVIIKMVMRHAFSIKYILVTPWINI
ncbi:MAG: cytochrome C [Candidatus Binatia bacterium]